MPHQPQDSQRYLKLAQSNLKMLEYAEALKNFKSALEIQRVEGENFSETLFFVGFTHFALGNHRESLGYLKSLYRNAEADCVEERIVGLTCKYVSYNYAMIRNYKCSKKWLRLAMSDPYHLKCIEIRTHLLILKGKYEKMRETIPFRMFKYSNKIGYFMKEQYPILMEWFINFRLYEIICIINRGYYEQSLKSIRSRIKISDKDCQLVYPIKIELLKAKALVYEKQLNYPKALKILDKAKEEAKKIHDEGHQRYISILHRIGRIHVSMQNKEEAKKIYDMLGFEISKDNPEVFEIMISMGNYFLLEEEYTKSYFCYMGALKHEMRLFKRRHPNVAWALYCIGNLLRKFNRS